MLDETKPGHEQVLNKIKTRFREETFTRESIREVIQAHPELVRMLYINFAMTHCELAEACYWFAELMYQTLLPTRPLSSLPLYRSSD